MKNLENFQNEAKSKGLQLIQINTDANDYPKGLGSWGAIGFDTFEDAELFAQENGGDVSHFKTKGGHTFWRENGRADDCYTSEDYIESCNDNVSDADVDTIYSDFAEAVKDSADNNDFENITLLFNELKKANDVIKYKNENETLIFDGNCEEYKIIKKEMMQYTQDVYFYAIGVYFNEELHAENEMEGNENA